MNARTLIVDDDRSCIDALKNYLASYPFLSVLGEVNSSEDALVFLENNSVDLLFLDIEMGGMDGIEFAHRVESLYPKLMIVFVTGHPQFALEGYEVHPVDFLTKPVNPVRLKKALGKVEERLNESQLPRDAKIGLNVPGGIHMIMVSDIQLIEKKGRKIYVESKEGARYETRETMKKLEEILIPFEFFRTHQSFLVPLRSIESITPDTFSRSYSVHLTGYQGLVPLSRKNYNELKDKLQEQTHGLTIH
ncbi:LytR/AlgR family response regulator transcription factor [Sporosarcina cyprini]|uniref:LytR/AlgR family response regulator transcription factor n=1 Tax=Sporosarcina cyprini TaxID=2910523 RepID=UPI001EDDE67F|nr:LytTR family DNA-binding domain-containing protein [Sporosarcina cyprini]MCG3087951.1 LytTR family DNA-binding domain-containing protein [Sporosarcina cyprini]